MKTKLKIIIPAIIAVIAVIIAVISLGVPKSTEPDFHSLVSTAQKYLTEQNYEQAIIEFNKIIELDPMNVDAYLGLAEAYTQSGNTEKAVEILEKGFELTGDIRLKELLNELLGVNEVSETTVESTVSETETTTETEQLIEYITIKEEQYPTNLTELDLSNMDLTDEDIKELYKMTDLTTLYLGGNQISNISPLSGLTNLTFLDLRENQISDISSLTNLIDLEGLVLDNNQIVDISALGNLSNLVLLALGSNQVSDISALSGLINLANLELNNNQISDISVLNNLTVLSYVDLSSNLISDISSLHNYKSEYSFNPDIIIDDNLLSDSDLAWFNENFPPSYAIF